VSTLPRFGKQFTNSSRMPPISSAQKAYESFVNCGQYMQELIAQKVEEGARSCLGRRLDQVKVIVVLSVIFQRYSLELAVDEWATDDEVANKVSNIFFHCLP